MTRVNRRPTQERKSDEAFVSGEEEHAHCKSNITEEEKTPCRIFPLTAQPWIFKALRELRSEDELFDIFNSRSNAVMTTVQI
ncbi:uncharacterized [Tachysurus ichikawai]